MLKKREISDVHVLFDLLQHPAVYPYVREKANVFDQYLAITQQTILNEQNGNLISRTICDETQQPIGIISLVDLEANTGFLATWIGQPYFGKGYNYRAKLDFLYELFTTTAYDIVFLKIRKNNARSLKANGKLDYVHAGHLLYPNVYEKINRDIPVEHQFQLFFVTKADYLNYYDKQQSLSIV
ncbi:GNAT family N-acetyltransferase [Paraliobacillus ryukyuensis]|uniref:GNAT family N-acetyltransferase n=1 Tax=Paraliobacillus ryukyuensis TaxID=200904 RepID=UPI0009A87BE4|nr:GNAT family protein [Paraliobacillus ryukyuensis]